VAMLLNTYTTTTAALAAHAKPFEQEWYRLAMFEEHCACCLRTGTMSCSARRLCRGGLRESVRAQQADLHVPPVRHISTNKDTYACASPSPCMCKHASSLLAPLRLKQAGRNPF